ncbi:MAG: ABC transporter permease [Tissierellia bacterium]|nr:ABC transporter permease [Tissierellia bacterium]
MTENKKQQNVNTQATSSKVESPSRIFARRFFRNKLAIVALVLLIIMALGAIFAPFLTPHMRDKADFANSNKAPDSVNLVGTDSMGRDMLTRLLWGGRISLTVGIFATFLRVLFGVVLGGIAGFYGGRIDGIIMRIADIFSSIPFLPMALTLSAALGPSIYNVMLVLAVLGWPGIARIVRAEILSLREREFMEAATALGISDYKKISSHLIPNTMASIIVSATTGVAGAILMESALSFLGLGVSVPVPSWGNMITEAQNQTVLEKRWWQWVPPGLLIFIAVISFNLLGDGLRDALDPRLKR